MIVQIDEHFHKRESKRRFAHLLREVGFRALFMIINQLRCWNYPNRSC